jgi:calcineurin-like phosphoesterase family protein
MTTYFSSDMHFGHQNIIKFSGRPYADLVEMEAMLISNWNDTVTADDTVWVLGDVAMGPIVDSLAACSQLNGHKILLCGNHDRPWAGWSQHRPSQNHDWVKRYMDEGGFEAVLDGRSIPGMALHSDDGMGDVFVRLCHFPRTGDHTVEERYKNWRPADDGGWLVHGHVHEAWKLDVPNRQINVGVDVWNYRPVSESTLANIVIGHQAERKNDYYVV